MTLSTTQAATRAADLEVQQVKMNRARVEPRTQKAGGRAVPAQEDEPGRRFFHSFDDSIVNRMGDRIREREGGSIPFRIEPRALGQAPAATPGAGTDMQGQTASTLYLLAGTVAVIGIISFLVYKS